MAREGEFVGHFRIERELGRGGMGVVYLAVDERLRRRVALKTLAPRYARDDRWLKRLAIEAERLGTLNHPHIAVIYERLDLDDGNSYLVMEYVEGSTLRHRLERGRIDLTEAMSWTAQVARALEAAHNRSIVHRDVKPENIQIRTDGVVKVLDFGLALETPPLQAGTDVPTRVGDSAGHGWVAGTPGYMSPEQARGRPVDRRSDVFSFGCVLFESITGRPAFAGASESDRIAATLQDEPDWDLLPASLPAGIRDLLSHCLEKNLIDRLVDISSARYQLEVCAGQRSQHRSRPAPPPPNNLPVSMQKFIGRSEIVDRLIPMLATLRLITIVGAAGCGKTSLAIRIATGLLQDRTCAAWFVDLTSAESPSHVPGVLGATIGVAPGGDQSVLEAVKSALAVHETLLILDNCEHLLPALTSLVAELLKSCPRLRIMATSREVLGLPAEQVFFLPPLALPGDVTGGVDAETLQAESVQLFIERARLVRREFDPRGAALAAVARICQRLDGIPLAIEIAAARVRMLTPEQIEQRLMLIVGGAQAIKAEQDSVSRHATMEAALNWSYRLLSDEDRLALHRLEVFAASFTLEAAQSVLEQEDLVTLEVLTRLGDKSLLVVDMPNVDSGNPGETRFRLLTLVREYLAAIRLKPGKSPLPPESVAYATVVRQITKDIAWSRVCEAHLLYCEQLAKRIESGLMTDAAASRAMLVAERPNLMAAMRYALGPDHPGNRGFEYANRLRRLWKAVFTSQSEADRRSALPKPDGSTVGSSLAERFLQLARGAPFPDDPRAFLERHGLSRPQLEQYRDVAMEWVAKPSTPDDAVRGRLAYVLCVAAALHHHGTMISDRPREDLLRLFDSSLPLCPPEWQGLLSAAYQRL